ncbi:MAG: peptidoglycan editing factor PgeF [Alphaproteobacteria bacterium]|nr:peptidoglycan editing factor PgeF [Alphaproteobacteria bacterium]
MTAETPQAPLPTPLLAPALRASGIVHGFFTREGGVTPEGQYAGLNCGFGSDDKPEHVAANRALAARVLGVAPERLLTVWQVHSPDVVTVTEPWSRDAAPAADALVTRVPGIALGVLAADCAPILFADAQAQVVGAAHAGWKGAFGGVIEATLDAMERLGADRARIAAAVGPCIAQASYEVGPEFRARFVEAAAGNARFFRPGRGDRAQFDLAGYVVARLDAAGVGTAAALGQDTLSDPRRFYSYRRACLAGETDYGRLLSAIALAER